MSFADGIFDPRETLRQLGFRQVPRDNVETWYQDDYDLFYRWDEDEDVADFIRWLTTEMLQTAYVEVKEPRVFLQPREAGKPGGQ